MTTLLPALAACLVASAILNRLNQTGIEIRFTDIHGKPIADVHPENPNMPSSNAYGVLRMKHRAVSSRTTAPGAS